MGDSRYEPSYERIRAAPDLLRELHEMDDDAVIEALAAASTHDPSPYLANVLASEALNRLRRARVVNENVAEGIFVLDARGHILAMNPASSAILGYHLDQLRGRDLSEICVDTGKEGHRCVHRIVLEERRPVHEAQDGFLHADGHVVRASCSGAPIPREGDIDGVVVAWRDVTRANEARRKIEESEARHRALFENSPDLIITLDREGRIAALNPAGERLSRVKQGDVAGRGVLPFIRPEDQERAQSLLFAAYGGAVQRGIFEVAQPDGDVLVYDAIAIPIRVGDEIVGVHGVARDISHLRRLERGIRESNARHELIMAGVKDHAIILLSPERIIESWNPGAERLFGWRAPDVIGRPCTSIFPARAAGTRAAIAALDDADRAGRAEIDSDALRADGTTLVVSGAVNRVVDATGLAHGYVVVMRDATPRRRAQLALERALATADAFAAARDLLAEGVVRTEAGRIVAANRAFLDLVGRPRAEVVGARIAPFFEGGEGDRLPPALSEHPRGWTRARLLGAGGRARDVEVAMRHVDPVEGFPPDGWVLLVRDANKGAPL